MKPYLPDKQQQRAQDLVAALNSRDPKRLQLLRNTSAAPDAPDNLQLDRLIEAAFPLPDCRYALDSVRDRGEQGTMDISWVSSDTRTYRYDILLTENCRAGPRCTSDRGDRSALHGRLLDRRVAAHRAVGAGVKALDAKGLEQPAEVSAPLSSLRLWETNDVNARPKRLVVMCGGPGNATGNLVPTQPSGTRYV